MFIPMLKGIWLFLILNLFNLVLHGYVRMGCLDDIVWASNIQNRFRKEIGRQCNLASITSGICRHPTLKSSHTWAQNCLSRIFSPVQSICAFPEYFLLFKLSVWFWKIFSCSTHLCLSRIFSLVQSICAFAEYFFLLKVSVWFWNYFSCSRGSRQIGPRTVGPRGPVVRGPTVRPQKVANWAPDSWAPEMYLTKNQKIIKKTKHIIQNANSGVSKYKICCQIFQIHP